MEVKNCVLSGSRILKAFTIAWWLGWRVVSNVQVPAVTEGRIDQQRSSEFRHPIVHIKSHFLLWRLEIMASTSSSLEQGYGKPLRYRSNEFQCISHLNLKLTHTCNNALIFLSESRQATFLSSFVTSLTSWGSSEYPWADGWKYLKVWLKSWGRWLDTWTYGLGYGKICIYLKVCMVGFLFRDSFDLLISCIRWECSRRYDHTNRSILSYNIANLL